MQPCFTPLLILELSRSQLRTLVAFDIVSCHMLLALTTVCVILLYENPQGPTVKVIIIMLSQRHVTITECCRSVKAKIR